MVFFNESVKKIKNNFTMSHVAFINVNLRVAMAIFGSGIIYQCKCPATHRAKVEVRALFTEKLTTQKQHKKTYRTGVVWLQ